MSDLEALLDSIRPARDRLLAHPVYETVATPEALRVFMEHHAFAVWDFMTLLKALQRALTCVEVPWVPTGDREARRLVNAIVLAEESDEDGAGGHASHFEMYLDAMTEAGADTGPVTRFVDLLRDGRDLEGAFEASGTPDPARGFVRSTLHFVESGSVPAIASAFTLGREDLIPDLFRRIVDRLGREAPGRLDRFRHYLDRHVTLDEGEHGPMALRMLSTACGADPARWRDARFAAELALDARRALWDGTLDAIRLGAVRA